MFLTRVSYLNLMILSLLFADGSYARVCDGKTKNQKIIQHPPKHLYIEEGNTALLNWTYCKAKENTVTGIIVYKVRTIFRKMFLISMDANGIVYKGREDAKLGNRLDLKKSNYHITFVIKTVQVGDRGIYNLEIRREGYADLHSRVHIRVNKSAARYFGEKGLGNRQENLTTTKVKIIRSTLPNFMTTTLAPPRNVTGPTNVSLDIITTVLTEKRETWRYSLPPEDIETNFRTSKSLTSPVNDFIKRRIKNAASKEPDDTFIALVCLSAAALPFALFIVGFAIVKLRRYRPRKRKKKSNNSRVTSYQIHEISSVSSSRHSETSGDLGIGSLSTMSGFSYRDSLPECDDQEFPSAITFGFTGNNRTIHPIPVPYPTTTYNIQQDANCPLLPKRKSHEIKRDLLQNLQIIGQGAFGLVAKADLLQEDRRPKKRVVAVKMLKEFASNQDRQDLVAEFNLMRRIDSHANVVKLIGCVMMSEPIWVVTEYVARGDLLGFLRKSRGIIDTTYRDTTGSPTTNLSQEQLLRMAKDITCGMTHLSKNKIIHRDLAARNVLVDENIECKITDFGMARDVKSTNYYRIKNRGRIPFNWTAIEAITEDKYTTKSDVWSFGVVLYEIVTIGGCPYSDLGPREILRRLKRGWRMEKPCHVNDELYTIMRQCWVSNPDDRPTFHDLFRLLGRLLGGNNAYINMKEYKGFLYGNIDSCGPDGNSVSGNEIAV